MKFDFTLVDTHVAAEGKSLDGTIEVTGSQVQITVGGRDISLALFGGSMELEVFKTASADPYIVHVWKEKK